MNQQSVQAVLNTYPNLLTVASAGDQGAARGAFTNAIGRYMAASQFIRSRRAGVRFFNLVTNDLPEEQNFRTFLTDLASSVSAPFGGPGSDANAIAGASFYNVIRDFTNHTISLANFFNGNFNLRSLLPALTPSEFTFVWDSFPDMTLGGVVSGLTQTNLGKAFVKAFHAQAQLNLPGVTCTVLGSAPRNLQGSLNGVTLGADGNLYGTINYGGAEGDGAFFSVPQGGGFNLLYSFGAKRNAEGAPLDGGNPSSLVLGSDNNFYGTTSWGGSNYNGTIFRITPGGSLKSLYQFGQDSDGYSGGGNPLALGSDGSLYGTTQFGGDNGMGIIFRFTPSPAGSGGQFTTLYSFYDAGAGALVQGSDGYFYGVTQFGGDNSAGSIFQFIPAQDGGQFNPLYSFMPAFDLWGDQVPIGVNPLVQGRDGNFYGTTQYGGDNFGNGSGGQGDGTLFRIDSNGNFTTLYSFDENEFDGFGPIGALVQRSNGDFCGITSSGGANGKGTLFDFVPGLGTGFFVWFNDGLGRQQSGQNGDYGMSYNFNSTVGLIKGVVNGQGHVYGTAPGGGANGNGTVFKLSTNSDTAALIVSSPPSSTNQIGSTVTLQVTASGTALTYQWARMGSTLPANASGATTAKLTLSGLTLADAGSYVVVVKNSYASAASAVAVLTVAAPPTITSQPATPVNMAAGGTLNLTVGAGGPGPLTYQWLVNNVRLTDGTTLSGEVVTGSASNHLTISPASTTDSGSYTVVVSNPFFSTNSHVSMVTVGVPPNVSAPASATNLVGNTNVMRVTATGTPPLRYQWRKNGTAAANNVAGATSNSLTLANLTLANAGSYAVVVTNTFGSVTSAVAVLTVVQGPTITSQPTTPVNIVQGAALSLKVGATGGSLAYQWFANNIRLANGGYIAGVAASNLVISAASTTNSGSYTVVVSNSIGAVTSKVSVVTVGVDKGAPGVTITSPAASPYPRLSAPVAFGGTASEANVLVTNVNYWITNLNGSPPTQGQARLAAGPGTVSNWTVTGISPPAGSNVFAVQSQDFSGNTSQVVSLKFFLKSPAQLTVITNTGTGNGTVKGTALIAGDTAAADGAMLNVGEAYSITATPGSNSFFVNWTGSAGTTNGQTLSFIMQNNTSLTANFITNIFVGMAGTYNGLFPFEAMMATAETAGWIEKLKLNNQGVYSAIVHLDGSAPGISGTFTHDGYATNVVPIALEKNVTVVFSLNTNSGTISVSVTGTNSQTQWMSEGVLLASLANTRVDAGAYTVLIPPASTSLAPAIPIPPGYGYLLLSNNPGTATVAPIVTITGALADGTTTLSQTVPIGEDNGIPVIPVYLSLYSTNAPGLLFGRISLSSTPGLGGPLGDLTWIRKASPSGLFAAGFTNASLTAQVAPWSNSVPLTNVILPNSQLTLMGGGFATPLMINVSVHGTNLAPAGTTPNYQSGSVNTNTGQFTITFTNNGVQTGRGAILQNMQNAMFGGGYFIMGPAASPTNAGTILWVQ